MAGLFIKLDVDFWDHPKIVTAGVMAGVLYQRMAMYCMQHTTDGFVPAGQLPRFALPAAAKLATALEDVGLIERVEGGWMVPGYVERYRAAAEVDDLRAKRAAAGRKGGRPRKQTESKLRKQTESKLLSPGFHDAKANGNPEVEVEVTKEPPPQVTPVPEPDDPAVVVASQLVDQLGHRNQPTPADLLSYVRKSLARGDTPEQLADCAADVLAMPPEQIETTPLKVLVGLLRKRINSPPGTPPRAAAAAAPRPTLDDERPTCSTCNGYGVAGGFGPDGRPAPVEPCPECNPLAVSA